ncbi:MAG TPA: ComF family protein [Acidimicrobiia bacterium]|jgi:predicted amidophosphoribosyltransferase
MALYDRLLQVVLPASCPGCATPAPALCPSCRAGLLAPPAASPPPGVDWWVAAFAYEGALRELVARAKYRGARTGWGWLAEALAEAVAEAEGAPALQAVTWPPTTPARRRQRGFDQAEWLARRVAGELSLPARPLLRRRPGPAQTGRDRRARAEHGPAFVASPAAHGACLLVDDVATTGATLASAAAALRAGGAVTVAAATAARTPHRGDGGKNYQDGLKAPLRGADF